MNCPKCATTLSAGAEFCGLCGSAAPANIVTPKHATADKNNDAPTELQSDLAAALAIGLQDEPTQLAPLTEAPKAPAAPISKAVPALSPISKAVPSLKEPTGKIRLPEASVSKSVTALSPASKATPALQAPPPVSRSVPSLSPASKATPSLNSEPPKAAAVVALPNEPKQEAATSKARKRWRRTTIKLKKRLNEIKVFRRGPQSIPPASPVIAAPQEPARPINRPTASPSQREILLGINEKMNAVATMIRTGELQVVDEPDGGLRSMVEPKASNASDYGALVSESSLKAVSRPDTKKAPPPPPAKKMGDFEDFGAPATDLPKAQPIPVRINTLELEIMEDPSEKLASGYAAHVAPAAPSAFKGIDSTVEPIVIPSKPSQDSGEIAIRKNASKSKTFMIAALALAAGAVGAFAIAPKSNSNTVQSVAAAAPPITVQPTMVTVSNDEKISQAAALAVQGKWEEAAGLAEEAQSPDLAKRYRIEGEVSQNLKDCRAARDERKLEAAMAACHLVEIVEGSQSAQIAIPEIEKLKKEYKTKHVPLTKKDISRNTAASLSEAKQEIELLALYLGDDHPDVNSLEKLYQDQLKKLPGKEKALTSKEPAVLASTPAPVAAKDPKAGSSLVPLTPTPTAAAVTTSGGAVYLVNGVYLSLGSFSNRTKDSALAAKYQSAISRNLSSSGKITAPPSGKDPITLLGAITKAETKTSGGSTTITVSVSLQVTRNKAILAFLSKDASAEFSGAITPAEEKSGKDEVIKALADGIFVDLKKSLSKFK